MLYTFTVHAAPTLEGMSMVIPEDGWRQVQNADAYESVCEGGNSCIVEAGRYKVINHITGETFGDFVITE